MGKKVKPSENNTTTNENIPVVETKAPTSYVVLRAGYRVSDVEYSDPEDPKAKDELEFWSRVEKNHSYGAPVEITGYNPRKHRVW